MSSSIASGCWITPTLPDASTYFSTALLTDAHPHALQFYDRVGAKGTPFPWKLYQKPSIPKEVWESKFPLWSGMEVHDQKDEKIFSCRGDEFRFFDDPRSVLSLIVQDALDTSPACRYMANMDILRIEPSVKKRRFGSRASTHVNWTLFTNHKDRPTLQANQIIIATGADFLQQHGLTSVPELDYLRDAMHISKGSVVDLESSQPFAEKVSQQSIVLCPLPTLENNGVDAMEKPASETNVAGPRYRARLGSTHRVHESEVEEKAEAMLKSAKEIFGEDLPSDARIVSTRTGDRLYRANRLPIVGGLLDPFGTTRAFPSAIHGGHLPSSAPRLAGLYYIGGMGSRGFTLAPILSKMLVEQICGPMDVRSLLMSSDNLHFRNKWRLRLSPRHALSQWLRKKRPDLASQQPHWNVDWPQLIGHSTPFPEDYDEAKQSFNIIPTSWKPARPNFESSYCPLFDDDHTRD